ncbi:Condensin-2 complex subunit G2 [Perkinsus olseni]|uniref:Condensin-2 complex subunit G2 n=1 Tax=Perkinsus olseni TaxID=32597 RepID=A0A7J6LUL2_PEROL|nr:Condensin-2 complex subunit G2 [Perkinsus olseni]
MKRLVTINALLLESSNPVASGCCFELQSSSKWKGPREGVYTFMAGSSSIISSLRLAGSLSIQRAFSSSTAGSAGVNYKSLLRPWKAMKLTQESLDEVRQQSLGTLSLVELVHQVMLIDTWPKAFPFPPECFDKLDGAPDADFYKVPKLDMHISEQIAECLEKRWYADLLPMACDAHLELGAGVRSYFPESYTPSTVIGYGMNMAEMERNDVLTERHVQDLNMNPHLPYQSNVVDCHPCCKELCYAVATFNIAEQRGVGVSSELAVNMPPRRRRQPPRRAAKRAASDPLEDDDSTAPATAEAASSSSSSSSSTAAAGGGEGAPARRGGRAEADGQDHALLQHHHNADEDEVDVVDEYQTPLQIAKDILIELDKCLLETATLTDVKRVYKLRHHLKNIRWELADTADVREEEPAEQEEVLVVNQLYKKLERCICRRIFHRNDNGIAFVASVLTMHPAFIVDAFAAIKLFIPQLTAPVLQGLSKALYRGWKESSGGMKRQMEQAIQAWMDYSLKVDPVLAKKIRILLSEFHRKDRRPTELENLLVELYHPILWKQLTVTNWKIRLNAIATLGDAFPICNSTLHAEMERTMDMQIRALVSGMTDKHDQVRRIAVNKVCESLAIQWRAISGDHRSVLLYNIINKCAKDKRSAAVRMAVVQGIRRIIRSCAISHQIMGPVLPKIGEMIYDPSPQVRLEYCKLLRDLQNTEGINLGDMAEGHQKLTNRLVVEHAYAMRKKEKFTQQDVKQAGQEKDVYVQIACSLGSILGQKIFRSMDVKGLKQLAKADVNVFIALMANCHDAEGATPTARIRFAAALFKLAMDMISKEDERHESIVEAAAGNDGVRIKLTHTRVLLRGVVELLSAEDVHKILHFEEASTGRPTKRARPKKRARTQNNDEEGDETENIIRQRDDFYQNFLTDYNMTKLLEPSRGCFIEAVEILRLLSPEAYKHVRDRVVRFVKSTSSRAKKNADIEEDQDYYYGMLRLASAWNVSKDAITNLAKRISACTTVLNGKSDMRRQAEVVSSSLKALNGPLKAMLELRLEPKYLLPLQDPVLKLIESLVDHLPYGLPVESQEEICSAFSLALHILINICLQGTTAASSSSEQSADNFLLDVFTELGDTFRNMKPTMRRGCKAEDIADAAPLVHEMGHRYLRHLTTTVFLEGLSSGTAEARMYDIQRTMWEWVIASGWNPEIPVWKTVADLLHELGFTGNMSTSLVMNTLQLNLSHVSTLHPREGEEAFIDKMAKVAATKYGYDAQFKEFLRKRVICECEDDEDEEGYAAEENACHERVWQAFKRVALGPPVNKALAELLNIEVEELQPQGNNNKENNPDQVGASEGNGSITPKGGRMHGGGSSSSSALPGEVIIQSGAPTPVHREDGDEDAEMSD